MALIHTLNIDSIQKISHIADGRVLIESVKKSDSFLQSSSSTGNFITGKIIKIGENLKKEKDSHHEDKGSNVMYNLGDEIVVENTIVGSVGLIQIKTTDDSNGQVRYFLVPKNNILMVLQK